MSEKGGLEQAKNEGGAVGSKRGWVSAWRRLEDATLRWMKRLKNHAEVEEKIEEDEQGNDAEAGGAQRDEVLEVETEVSNRAVSCLEKWCGVARLSTRWRDSESPGGEVVMADAEMINWQRWV